MSRGLGTALGVSITSLVLSAGRGLTSISLLLLAMAVVAGAVAVVWTGPRSQEVVPLR